MAGRLKYAYKFSDVLIHNWSSLIRPFQLKSDVKTTSIHAGVVLLISEQHYDQWEGYLLTCLLSPVKVRVDNLTCLLSAHLFVHERVDEWVVDTRALGEKRRDGDESIIFVLVWWVGEVKSCESVWTITDDEGSHHDDDHSRYFLLRPLGRDRLRLLGCYLNMRDKNFKS